MCNWRGSPQRPGRMKSIIQNRIIQARTQSQNEKFSNQSTTWSKKVKSGHNICCLCSFPVELSSCRVTYENCYKASVFFNLVWGEWMNLRNSKGIELRNFYFTTVWKLFSKDFIRSGKMHHVELNQVLPNQVSKKSFDKFEDIDFRESHAKLDKKPSETLGEDWI